MVNIKVNHYKLIDEINLRSTTKTNLFKRRVARGVFILGIRRVLYQLILTTSNIVLARNLEPKVFGAFAIISFLVITPGILTNFGLGPALIQEKGKVTIQQLRAVFTLLIFTPLVLTIIIYFLAPLIGSLYMGKLDGEDLFWLRIFPLSITVAHASTVSMRLLDRNLAFTKSTIGELIMLFVTQISTVILAINGFGVGSFVVGNLIGGVFGFALFYYLSPWPIGFHFSLRSLKPLLPFGLNYQANNIIGAVNSAVTPGFIGIVSGPTAVGFVNWAGGVRQAGLAPFDVIEKLIFPAASRVQENKKMLTLLIEKLTRISCMLSFPLLAILFALAPSVTSIIYTSKWLPGLTALYLSLIQGVFLLLGFIMIDILLALGKAKTVRNISLFWAILQWVLTIPLVLLWDFNGAVLAGVIVSATFFIPLIHVRKYVSFNLLPAVGPYIVYSITTCLALLVLDRIFIIKSIWEFFLMIGIGFFIYFMLLMLFERKNIFEDLNRVRTIVLHEKV